MRDIKNILKLFAHHNMDYCDDFDAVKSIFHFVDENVRPLKKVQFRGGNEDVISEIANRIRSHFLEKDYIDPENDNKPRKSAEQSLRKITFFMVLNADVVYKYDLKADKQIVHLLDLFPQLPKTLLVLLVWKLHLDDFFYEVLTYTPIWFSFQFMENAIASIKYFEPYEALDKVENLVKSIYFGICRSDVRATENVDKTIILNKFYDFTMDLLRQFYTPDIEKFSNWSKMQFFKYSGVSIRHILDMLLFCFDHYENRVQYTLEDKYAIYEVCKDKCPVAVKKDAVYSDLVVENLKKIYTALLNSLQYNVMLVTVDVFLSWVEVDITEDQTLQAAVGERVYYVLERMASNKNFNHDVQQHLKFLSIKPKQLEETVKELTIGDILRKIDGGESDHNAKKILFNELISRGEIVFGNDECLETLSDNLKLMDVQNCHKILDFLKLKTNPVPRSMETDDSYEDVIPLLLKSLDHFNAEQLQDVVIYEIKLFGMKAEVLERDDFTERCTEFFNKSSSSFDSLTFLQLCVESPRKVWRKFFHEACLSQQQVENFSQIATNFRPLAKVYCFDLLTDSFPGRHKDKFYPNIIAEICQCGVIDKDRFFKLFVYSNVMEMLDIQNYQCMLPILEALVLMASKTTNSFNFGSTTAPILVMAAQIMEKCRWDMITYTHLKDQITRTTIAFTQTISNKFLPIASERDKKWITDKVTQCRPITRYYFQKYSLAVNQQPKTFDEFLEPNGFANDAEIERFISTNFVRCTAKEAEWLARNNQLVTHFPDFLLTLEEVVNEIGCENAIDNFRHCAINYANILRKIVIPSLVGHREKAVELGFKILTLVHKSHRSIYEELFMCFQGIALEVFEKAAPVEEDVVRDVRKFVSHMKDCKGKELIHEKFQAMVMETLK